MEATIKKIRFFWFFSLILAHFQQKKRKNQKSRQIYDPAEDLIYLPEHMKRDIGWLE